jgi:glycerate kinase
VRDPLGRPVNAVWGLLGDGRSAVVEMAEASGLPLLWDGTGHDERNPLTGCTYGTGQLVRAALRALHSRPGGPKKLIIGIGGSATNDAGAGALRALGAVLSDASGKELEPGGAALARLARIDVSGLDPLLARTEILVACDVDNPLCGPRGASAVFGPQKGASTAMVEALDSALGRFASVAAEAIGRDIRDEPGAGAAGGLGAGLLLFTGAALRPGVGIVLEALDIAERAARADLVLTGEGLSDAQTAHGKAPAGVAAAARRSGTPVICVSGALGQGVEALYDHGVDAVSGAVSSVSSLEDCLRDAAPLLEKAVERACRLLRLGMRLRG